MIIKGISNILFVGDIHLNSSTPQSRIDDYSITSINKLKQIRKICENNGYEVVILTGDIFHKNRQPLSYLNKVVETFKSFRDRDIKVYTIAGNHDLSYDKMEYIDHSPLGNVLTSDIVMHLDELEIETETGYKVKVKGFDYPDELEPSNTDDISICIAHRFYENMYEDKSITKKDVEDLGYDIYVLGHDHRRYQYKKIGGSFVIRPGSVMRGTSHNYNLEREVFVDAIKFNGEKNRPKISFVKHKLNIAPAEQVFTASVFGDKENDGVDMITDLSEDINNLLDQMDSVQGENPVYQIMDDMKIDEEVKERIETYLSNYGIYRMEG
jgi:DNA repair exonuclease SbcCD nuclease subunit